VKRAGSRILSSVHPRKVNHNHAPRMHFFNMCLYFFILYLDIFAKFNIVHYLFSNNDAKNALGGVSRRFRPRPYFGEVWQRKSALRPVLARLGAYP